MRPGSAIWRTIKGAASAVPFFRAVSLLVLSVCGANAYAFTEPSCAAGLSHKWSVDSAGSGITGNPCSFGNTFSSYAETVSSCLPPHGTVTNTGTGWHMSGVATDATLITGSKYSFKSNEHNSTHTSPSLRMYIEATHSCVSAVCNLAAGVQVGGTYVTGENLGNKICSSECETTFSIVADIKEAGIGKLYGLVVNSGSGPLGGKSCTGAEVTPTSVQGSCVGAGVKQQCQDKGKNGPTDGTVPGVTPPVFAGPSWQQLTNEGCVTTERGGRYCLSTAPSTLRPDTGLPGVTAPPDVTTDYKAPAAAPGQTTTTTNYYTSSTILTSTNLGTGGDPTVAGNCGAPGQPSCATKGSCGGPGQPACVSNIDCGGVGEPPCGVKVDETGVADAWATTTSKMTAAEADITTRTNTAATTLSDSTVSNNPSNGWSPGTFIPNLESGSCQTIEIQFFLGPAKVFPPSYLCSVLENKVKPLLGFFVYVLTAFSLVIGAARSMTGNT